MKKLGYWRVVWFFYFRTFEASFWLIGILEYVMNPKHGDERNQRIEKTEAQFSSHEFSISERYCEKCKSWGEVKGLVNSNFCPTCDIPFDKSWWEDSEKHTH